MSWKSRRAIAKGAALVAIGIVIARSHTEWPIEESWIELGIAAAGAAVAIDPLTRRRVEIRPTVRVTTERAKTDAGPAPRPVLHPDVQTVVDYPDVQTVVDDGPGRAFHTMADYRKWGDENLPRWPRWLGFAGGRKTGIRETRGRGSAT